MRYKILLVCMGNICRSPTAHGVLRHRLQQAHLSGVVAVDSAGTHSDHVAAPPDARSQAHALRRGYDLSDLRARQVTDDDYATADLILAMDWDNLALLQAECPAQHQHKLRRFAEFFKTSEHTVVPDPYHGGADGFDGVLDLVEDGCTGLLQHLVSAPVLARCVPEWSHDATTGSLTRQWEMGSFKAAMAFIQRVAELAELHNHHPEIWNVYQRVRLTLTTHDAGGLTHKDVALASAISALATC
jgi:protein-tyrosine phosphatase